MRFLCGMICGKSTNQGESAVLNLEMICGHAAEQRAAIAYWQGGGHGCTRGSKFHTGQRFFFGVTAL